MPASEPLLPSFRGQILAPGDDGYEQARRVHNGMIDKRPALITRCVGVADIADAVRYATAHWLEISVRGGGHNVGGRAVTEGGLMIDLSAMKSVHVDAAARTAVCEGGALWRELNRETQLHGLAVTGGVVGSTGVAGLTLGGGLGWLMSKFGLALDNLLAVTVVLADGSVVRASAAHHPDLFWALRGGGGNFGVAAAFEFRLHPLGPLTTGGLAAFAPPDTRAVLRGWRAMMATAGDDLTSVAALISAPDGSGAKIAGIAACHTGAQPEAEAAMAHIRSFGTVVHDALGPIPYTTLNTMMDGDYPRGAHNYWKSAFMPELSDAAIEVLAEAHAACPSGMSQLAIEHLHGAVCRVPLDATACTLRTAGFNALVVGQWQDPALSAPTIAWVRETFARLQPFVTRQQYVNYVATDEDTNAAARGAYGPHFERLQAIKRQYDPGNVFHLNVNIVP